MWTTLLTFICGLSLLGIGLIEILRSRKFFYWPGQVRLPPTGVQKILVAIFGIGGVILLVMLARG
jgi:hypothetical protein